MTNEHYKQWISDLEVGDEVVVGQPNYRMPYYLSRVREITTERCIFAKGFPGTPFINGRCRVGTYEYNLLEPTNEQLDKINLINMRRQFKAIDWNKVDDEIVRDVWNLTNR